MAGPGCFIILPVVLTAVFGYPLTVSTVQGYLTTHKLADETENTDTTETLVNESVLRAIPEANTEKFSQPETLNIISVKTNYPAKFSLPQVSPPSFDFYGQNDQHGEKSAKETSVVGDDDEMFKEPTYNKEESVILEEGYGTRKNVVATESSKDNSGMGQHFFPSFAPVFSLGHSRPPQLFHQDQYYSKSRSHPSLGPDYNPFRAYRDNSFKVPITVDDDPSNNNILGSGNFGVLKGGTYYNDDVGDLAEGLFKSFYSNNGHGRPYSSNPRPQKYSNNDFFANFRDFADINTPTKTSFSEYVVVYVNKNTSKSDEGIRLLPSGMRERPKNIIEQLSMLDNNSGESEPEISVSEKKLSPHKRKLALLQQEKASKEKHYYKKKEPMEPLLALS